MNLKTLVASSIAAAALAWTAGAQTNLQVYYDFARDRGHVTTTLEGFYNDRWGNTFFFVDYDYNQRNNDNKVYSPSGTYFEIARCLNFWKGTKMAALSIHLEYDGGVYKEYTINNAFLFGADWFMHSADYRNTFNIKLLGKYINYNHATKPMSGDKRRSIIPMQITAVWGMKDLFSLKGLSFSGFADFWWESHQVCPVNKDGARDWTRARESDVVFITEPQLWYCVGQHFGVENLNVGTEIELSYDFGTAKGFWCRPCLGMKWIF